MLPNNNSGRMVVKIVIVLVLLAGAAFVVINGAQKRALVKVAKTDTAVDAVTGGVTVDADGGTQKELKAEAEGKVIECDKIFDGAVFKKNDVLLRLDTVDLLRTDVLEVRGLQEQGQLLGRVLVHVLHAAGQLLLHRRVTGRSSGDTVSPKRPGLSAVR